MGDSVAAVLFDESSLAWPYPVYDRLRAVSAVHYEPSLDLYFVLGHDAIREVLDDPDVYSSHLVAVLQRDATGVSIPSSDVPAGLDVLAVADPPAHTLHRRLAQPTFGKREVQTLRAAIQEAVIPRVEAFTATGGGDWMAAVAAPVPVQVISGILGLPTGDAERLVGWSDAAVELLNGLAGPERLAMIIEKIGEFMAYLSDRLTDGSGALMDAIRGAVESGPVSHDEAVNLLTQLVTAGTESTTSLLGSAVRALADDPELQTRLRAEPALVGDFVEEVLRLESPFRGHFRLATRDTTLAGTAIPSGGRMMLLWGAANRDPGHYENPGELDLARPGTQSHLAFGRGIHFCIGAHLARLEAQMAIQALLDHSDGVELSADHKDRYRPSLLVRRLEEVLVSVAPAA